MQGRWQLTDRIKEKSLELLWYEITQKELRFMVYVQYIMCNEQKLDIARVSPEEREILKNWKEKEYCEGGAGWMTITKEFWDAMCEIIFLWYVDLSE